MLTDEQLEEFRKIYKAKFGKEITKAEALAKGLPLVNMMKTILLENERQDNLENNKNK
ncbi:MAG: hypothetical protein NTW11_01435 [Candidatus Staskawiczbacteria bacterium]|nr:hypothetical protein [Candidatus Staskawiczbacteria bacterium]